MYRVLGVVILGVGICASRPVMAQPPSKDEVRKLEAEVEKLRDQIQNVEARLKKAKAEMDRKDDSPSSRRWGSGRGRIDPERIKKLVEQFGGKDGKNWGRMDAEQFRKMVEAFRKMSKEGDSKDANRSRSPWSRGWGRFGSPSWGFGSGGWRRPSADSKSSEIEKRLDRIIEEVEGLRREIRKQ